MVDIFHRRQKVFEARGWPGEPAAIFIAAADPSAPPAQVGLTATNILKAVDILIIKISYFQFWLTKIRFLPYCRLFNPINFILPSSWWGDLPDTLPGQPGSDDPAADLSGAGTRRPPLRQPGEPLPQLPGLLWAQRAGPASTLRPAWPTIRHTSLWLGPESSLSSPWPAAAWSWWRRG